MSRDAGPRAWLGSVLLVLGAVVVPLSLVATHVDALVRDQDALVAVGGPLAGDPTLQARVSGTVANSVNQALTQQIGLEVPGVEPLVAAMVQDLVASDRFDQMWRASLRVMLSQLGATAVDDPNALFTLGNDGAVDLQFAPVGGLVRQWLVDRNVPGARFLPDMEGSVQVGRSETLARLPGWLSLLDRSATLLPWSAGVLLLLGLVVAPRRRRALTLAGLTTAVAALATWLLLGWGRAESISLADGWLTAQGAGAAFDGVTKGLTESLLLASGVALVVALTAFVSGRLSPRRRAD